MNKSVKDAAYNENFGRTICEVHREIYDIICDELKDHPSFDNIEVRLDEAYTMAKKMDAKLRQYANRYDDGWWEQEKKSVIKDKLKRRESRQ